ncbi:MAG: HAD family phosphatase [Chloroflexi bacterium]|nr:HAD family phosphatase [Chloroflexota bacterium]
MSRFEAAIFDMDGVLIDSEPLHFAALAEVLARAHYTFSRAENEQFIGTTSEAMFSTLIARHGLPGTVRDYEQQYDETLLRVLHEPHDPAPGVTALLERLRALGVRIAVASSSRRLWIDATLSSMGLANAFEVLVAGDDVEHGKPQPAIYLLAAERLGVPPERCLAIEDSPNGVQSACAAGMTVLGVRTEYTAHLHLEGATRIVDSLADLDLTTDLLP